MNRVLTIAISGKKGHGKDTVGGFILEHAEAMGWNVVRKNLADPLKEEAARAIAVYECRASDQLHSFGAYTSDTERIEADFNANPDQWEPVIYWFSQTYGVTVQDAATIMKAMAAAALSDFDDPSGEPYCNMYKTPVYEQVLSEFHDPKHKHLWRVFLQWWGTEFRRRLCGDGYWRDKTIAFNRSLPDKTVHGLFDVRFPDEFDAVRNELTNGFLIRVERPSVAPDGDEHPSETALDNKKSVDWNCVVINEVGLDELRKGAEVILSNALAWARLT